MKSLINLSGPVMVVKGGVWSNVVSAGIMRLVCMRLSISWSISGG